jgi:hypothetical protein
MELLGTVMLDSPVIFCAEKGWYDYVVEWARENDCPEP